MQNTNKQMLVFAICVCTSLECEYASLLITRTEKKVTLNGTILEVNANFHRIGTFTSANAALHNCWNCASIATIECKNSSAESITATTVQSVFAAYLSAKTVSNSIVYHAQHVDNIVGSMIVNITGSGPTLSIKNSVVTCFECTFDQVSEIANSRVVIKSKNTFATTIGNVVSSSIEYYGYGILSKEIASLQNSVLNIRTAWPEQHSFSSVIGSVGKALVASVTVSITMLRLTANTFAIEACSKLENTTITVEILVSTEIGTATAVAVLGSLDNVKNVVVSFTFYALPEHQSSKLVVYAIQKTGPLVVYNLAASLYVFCRTPLADVALPSAVCWQNVRVYAMVSAGKPPTVENNTCAYFIENTPVVPEFTMPQFGVQPKIFHYYGKVLDYQISCYNGVNTNDFTCLVFPQYPKPENALNSEFVTRLALFGVFLALALAMCISGIVLCVITKHRKSSQIIVGDIANAQVELKQEINFDEPKGTPTRLTPEDKPYTVQPKREDRFERVSISSTESSVDEVELMRQQMRGQAGCVEVYISKDRERKIMTGAREKIVKVAE